MKTIKMLLAASILTVAGASNAAIIGNYSVTLSGITSGFATGSLSGTGTATFDDSGVLTIDYTALNNQPSAGASNPFTTTVKTIFTGTISGDQFTATAGTSQITSCTVGTTICPVGVVPSTPQTLTPTPTSGSGGGLLEQAFDIRGLFETNTSTAFAAGGLVKNSLSYQFACVQWEGCGAVATTPLPGSVWLLSSGLIGLAGAARRRKTL